MADKASTAAGTGLSYVRALIQPHPHFPIPGVLFHDVFPIFRDPKGVEITITALLQHILEVHSKVDVIVGIDSRGFVFGPILAMRLGCAFTPVRKPGKLPGKVERIEYKKEYGTDVLEIQEDAIKPGNVVIVVDDLLATGGTMASTCALVEKMGGVVAECVTLVTLPELKPEEKIGRPCFALFALPAGC